MIKLLALAGVGLAALAYSKKAGAAVSPGLKYFSREEFGDWWEKMSPELLQKLDAFREEWGAPVEISRAQGALGREDFESDSQHNYLKWGEVRAVDVFPVVIDLGEHRYIENEVERMRAYMIAKKVGFTGIGLYTDTYPGNMLHVDVRQDRSEQLPATWSRVGGEYLGIEAVMA